MSFKPTDGKVSTPNRDGCSLQAELQAWHKLSCLWPCVGITRQAEVEPPTPSPTVSLHSIPSSDNWTDYFLLPRTIIRPFFSVNKKQKKTQENQKTHPTDKRKKTPQAKQKCLIAVSYFSDCKPQWVVQGKFVSIMFFKSRTTVRIFFHIISDWIITVLQKG